MKKIVALLAVALLLVAACSKSEPDGAAPSTTGGDGTIGDGTTAPTEPATLTTRGITDTTVRVGGLYYADFFGGADIGARARFDRANAAGGVNGRTIELVAVQDDGSDPTVGQAQVEQLVQQEEVFALVPVVSGAFGAGDLVDREKVPVFGWGIDPVFCGNDLTYGFTGCVTDPDARFGSDALGLALAAHFDGDTAHRVAVVGEDSETSRLGLELVDQSIADVGFDVVLAENPLPTPPAPLADASPIVADILSTDPDVVVIVSGLNGSRLSETLQGAGFDGLVLIPAYDPRIAALPGFDGATSFTQWATAEYTDVEAMAELIADVHAIAPDQAITLGVMAGYLSADLFVAALEAAGPDPSVESMAAVMNDGFTWEVEGVVGELTFPDAHEQPTPCMALVSASNGQYAPDVPLTCGSVFAR